mmetsp:Transcript_32446/g.29252  ORF Transcript_32446/g.29252 Transcript_32446/m.29252 type:complete len:122 (-) Transcript_32446:426-791(-)
MALKLTLPSRMKSTNGNPPSESTQQPFRINIESIPDDKSPCTPALPRRRMDRKQTKEIHDFLSVLKQKEEKDRQAILQVIQGDASPSKSPMGLYRRVYSKIDSYLDNLGLELHNAEEAQAF